MSPRTWSSQNDLPEAVRLLVIPLLNQQLADAIDLGFPEVSTSCSGNSRLSTLQQPELS